MKAPYYADLDERAAVLEFDNGMTRAEAERQAIEEALERGPQPLPGILWELVDASRRRLHPDIDRELAALGLTGGRAPLWGIADVIEVDGCYQPAAPGEGRAAFIAPAIDGEALVDLVAHGVNSGRLLTRLGAAPLLGADEIERSLSTDMPLYVFDGVPQWLRGQTRGVVPIDWQVIGREIEGVHTLICGRSIAPRLYAATMRCWPTPTIATPDEELRHAA